MAAAAACAGAAAGITVVGPVRAPATMPKFAWLTPLERPAEWLVLALTAVSTLLLFR